MRRAALLLLILCALVVPVFASDNGAGTVLFARVVPEQVHHLCIYEGMGVDEHSYRLDGCNEIAPLGADYGHDLALMTRKLQTITALAWTTQDRIQPYTWDFTTGTERRFTPLVWMVVVRETDGQTTHQNTLSCYDTGQAPALECRLTQGAADAGWHWNQWYVDWAALDTLLRALTAPGG